MYRIICLLTGLICISGCEPILTEKSEAIPSYEKKKIVSEKIVRQEIPVSDSFSPDEESLLTPMYIVSLGDSLTEGVGSSMAPKGYLANLKKQLESDSNAVEIVNYGIEGNRSAQLLRQLGQKKVQKDLEKADIVVMTIGGNDIMNVFRQNFMDLKMKQFKSAKREYEVLLNQILDKIRTYNQDAQIYFIGLYNPFSKNVDELYEVDVIISDWNKSVEKIVESYNLVHYIKIEDIFENTKEDVLYKKDFFHPNDRGYELIASRVYDHMAIYLSEQPTTEAGSKGDEIQQ